MEQDKKWEWEKDKKFVLTWMENNCPGVKNAKTRRKILPFVNMDDRRFRAIVSELKHENHIASTSSRGYWHVPLVTTDPGEIEAVLESCFETKSRALDQLVDCDKNIKFWLDRKCVIEQGQREMELVG